MPPPGTHTRTAEPHALAASVAQELRAQAVAHPGELLGLICADTSLDELTSAGMAGQDAATRARLVPASEARGLACQ